MKNTAVIVGLILLISAMLCLLAVYLLDKEHKKQLREEVDKARTDWAKAFDAANALQEKEADALKYALSVKDDLIAEKDKRIEQLEADIAMKDMIMACAKVDGSVDVEKIKEMMNGPYTCEELVYNE